MNTWLDIDKDSDFSIYNIPFGVFSIGDSGPKIGTRIGDHVLDLHTVATTGLFDKLGIGKEVFSASSLNDFIALGKSKTNGVRLAIQAALQDESSYLKNLTTAFIKASDVQMHMPVEVKDYTDFYSSIDHATNVGIMFRDKDNALLPNWKHLPVGYHGRASSIIPSGTNIHRPKGQMKPTDSDPVYGPCRLLDFELEMAFVVGKQTKIGQSISTVDAMDHIFGMVLFNDWSARDIQKWEYIPLGPFLAKSFASSISPWIVTMEALEFAKVHGQNQEPAVLPYLQYEGPHNFDIKLDVGLTPQDGEETIICGSNFKYMYWNMAQQLAHHTSNGCNVNIGDMMASGTISGPEEGMFGCMLELSWAGTKNIQLIGGEERKFIADYDTITMYGHAEKDGKRVGFGKVRTQVLPAL